MRNSIRGRLTKNKKGFMYSLIVVIFIILIIASYMVSSKVSLREQTYSSSRAIKKLDNKLNTVQEDTQRGLYIVGFRTLIAMDDIISKDAEYFNDVNTVFSEIFFNGTYEGENITIMNGTTFYDFKKDIEDALRKENIILNITPHDVSLSMSSPWNVRVTMNATISLQDFAKLAGWNNDFLIYSDVSIVDLNDPLYLVYSDSFVRNQIRKSNITLFVSGAGNTDNLWYHMNNSLYIASDTAPNYLMRLEGDISPDESGIESLINYDKFEEQGFAKENRSSVDYIYLANGGSYNLSSIAGSPSMPSWFKLDYDDNHIIKYNCSNIDDY